MPKDIKIAILEREYINTLSQEERDAMDVEFDAYRASVKEHLNRKKMGHKEEPPTYRYNNISDTQGFKEWKLTLPSHK